MQDEKAILRRAEEIIDARAAEMAAFSDWLAEHPELSGEEYESSRLMAEKLRGEGFEVEYPFCGIPTAFMAKKSFGAKKPAVAIMAEYDALPGIGHGCGHNLHGTMSLYAGLALGEAMAGAGLCGELRVVGTPAEEGDGAKIKMADDGVFDDADLAVMIHSDAAESLADYRALGLNGFDFTFTGQTAHSAGSPWDGRSAQSGALLFMEAMNMLRLHMRDGCRLHALITHVSGAANIIPDKAVCRVEARAPEKNMLDELTEGVFRCARGAAVATATEVSWERFEGHFEPVLPNPAAEKLAEECHEGIRRRMYAGPRSSGLLRRRQRIVPLPGDTAGARDNGAEARSPHAGVRRRDHDGRRPRGARQRDENPRRDMPARLRRRKTAAGDARRLRGGAETDAVKDRRAAKTKTPAKKQNLT